MLPMWLVSVLLYLLAFTGIVMCLGAICVIIDGIWDLWKKRYW